MGITSKHKYSSYTLLLFGCLLFTSIVVAKFTSEDIDEVCDEDGKVLKRINGSWICQDESGTGTIIDEDMHINIENNINNELRLNISNLRDNTMKVHKGTYWIFTGGDII